MEAAVLARPCVLLSKAEAEEATEAAACASSRPLPWIPARRARCFSGVLASLQLYEAERLLLTSRTLREALPQALLGTWRCAIGDCLATGSDDGSLRLTTLGASDARGDAPCARSSASPRSLQRQTMEPLGGAVLTLAWSPSGSILAVGDDNGDLVLLREAMRNGSSCEPEHVQHHGRLSLLEWSACGTRLATACDTEDQTLRVLDVGDAVAAAIDRVEERSRMTFEVRRPLFLAALGWISERFLASVGERPSGPGFGGRAPQADSMLHIVDTATGATWEIDHGCSVTALAWNNGDGDLQYPLATGAQDGMLRIFAAGENADPLKVHLALQLGTGRLRTVVWDPRGDGGCQIATCRLACALDASGEGNGGLPQLCMLDTTRGVKLWEKPLRTNISSLQWSPCGRYLAVACSGESPLRLIASSTGETIHLLEFAGKRLRSAWSPIGRWLATVHAAAEDDGDGVHLRVVEAATGRLLRELRRPPGGDGFSGSHLCWSPSGRYVAAPWCFDDAGGAGEGSYRECIRILDVATGRLAAEVWHDEHVRQLAWRPP